MTFLAPLFLLGALAIAAPVIYHMIRRTTREKTLFSSLMFLMPSPPKLSRKSRLEDILLLLLRCAALALFAFAFSRPFIRTAGVAPAAPAAGSRTVIVLDVSASMQRSGLWNEARDRASEVIRRASPIDEVAVLAYDRQVRTLVSFEEWRTSPVDQRAALASNRIQGTTPGWKGTNLGNALIAAADALGEGDQDAVPGPREIVLISDMQSGSQLGTLQAYEWPKGIRLTLETIKPGRPSNAGLQLVAEAADADPKAEPAARVRITNSPDSSNDRFRVGWARAEAPQAIVGEPIPVVVSPGQSTIVRVPAPAGAAGLRRIVLLDDDEPFDNTVYAVPPEKRQVKVFYFGSETLADRDQPLFTLNAATDALSDARNAVTLIAPRPGQPPAPEDLQDAKLFFLTDATGSSVTAELRRQLETGKTVVFAPRSAAAATQLSELLGGTPVTMREGVTPSSGPSNRPGAPVAYSLLGSIEYQNPLFAPFNDPRYSDFSRVYFFRHRQLALDGIEGARVLARFDNDNPAVVEIPVGRGRILCLLAGWHEADSNFYRSTKFFMFVGSLLELSSGLSSQAAQFAVGDPMPVIGIAGTTGAMTVTPPGGSAVTLADGTDTFMDTERPGIYRLVAGARTIDVGVNLDPAESRTAPMPVDELERYGAPGGEPVVNAAYTARKEALLQASEAEGRQKLWRWFIGLTLLVLLVESILAGWTARRNAASV